MTSQGMICDEKVFRSRIGIFANLVRWTYILRCLAKQSRRSLDNAENVRK